MSSEDKAIWVQFAAAAVAGREACSNPYYANFGACSAPDFAERAAKVADAMLKEYRKRFPQ